MAYRRSPTVENQVVVVAGASADCQHRGQPTTLWRQRRVSHCVDAAMNAMQASSNKTSVDRVVTEAYPVQLSNRDHAVLPRSDFSDIHVGFGDFLAQYKG